MQKTRFSKIIFHFSKMDKKKCPKSISQKTFWKMKFCVFFEKVRDHIFS